MNIKLKTQVSLNNQSGVALFTILIFLLLLGVLGLSSMETSRLEQMMSGNMQWNNIAFQAAELGLSDTIKKSDWAVMVATGNVASQTYNGSSNNIYYTSNSYHVGFSQAGRVSRNAWSAGMRRANFSIAIEANAKVEGAANPPIDPALATVLLEEGVYLPAPKK